MTTNELETLRDILHWAKHQVKTDGMYVRINLAMQWVERDIKLKTMNPVLTDKDDES